MFGQWAWVLALILIVIPLSITVRNYIKSIEELRKNEEKFIKAFHLGPVGMAITSLADGRFIDANQSFLDMLEFNREEAIGHTSVELNIFTSDQRQKLAQYQKDKSGVKNLEITAQTKSGRTIDLLFSTEMMEIDGETCLLSILADVTESKLVEEELLEKRTQIQVLNDNFPNGYTYQLDTGVHGEMRRFVYISAGVEKIFGVSSEQILDNPVRLSERFLEEDSYKVAELESSALETMSTFKAEARFKRKNDQIGWLLLTSTPRKLTNNHIVWDGLALDITERKQIEMKEHEQRILAEALSSSAAALSSTLEFSDVLNRVLDNIGRVVPHDAANIMLLDKKNEILSLVAHRGYLERGTKESEIRRQYTLSAMPKLAEAARKGQPLLISDSHADPEWVVIPYTNWVKSYLTVPIQIGQSTVGFLNLDSSQVDFFNSSHIEYLKAFASYAAIAVNNARLYEDMKKLAVTDILTGIYNRLFFETELARIELSRDYPVSVVIADMDNLKTTNDNLGHVAGDVLLKRAAYILQESFRNSDIIARIGGDEFAVLLPNTDLDAAERALLRVRENLIELNSAHPDMPVEFSIGVATASEGKLFEAYRLADKRMYEDKVRRKSSRKM